MSLHLRTLFCLTCLSLSGVATAQEARLRPAPHTRFPTETDGNSSTFWFEDRLHLFTSIGWPLKLSVSESPFGPWSTANVALDERLQTMAIWMEGAWADEDGVVFGWYHHEPGGLYQDSLLTAPKIGAVISFDGGKSMSDLGFILESGDPLNDDAKNGSFTGGHGDFCVMLDRQRKYFYFFFSNYGGADDTHGVAVARMAYEDRFEPAGKVFKYYKGQWREPGRGGKLTPVFRAAKSWHNADPDVFWGPAVHWNTYLNCYVMLLNHAKGEPGWTQEGVYVTYSTDLSRVDSWKTPVKVMDSEEIDNWGTYYPQVMGLEPGGSDVLAGQTARFYLNGGSKWEIEFTPANVEPPPPAPEPPGRNPDH